MRIFVTGASGYIGRAVVRALAAAGHSVTGLARSDAAATTLRRLGAVVARADLAEPARWRTHLRLHDAVVHLAMAHGERTAEIDRDTVAVLLEEMQGAREPTRLVYTSGVMVLGDTGDRAAGEDATTSNAAAAVAWRPAVERAVLTAATDRLRTAVVRPGMVYGGGSGLVASLFDSAANQGAARIVGEGRNRWPPVHREDLAALYLRVLESEETGVFHGVEDRSELVADIARRASELTGAGGAVEHLPLDAARAAMGPFADALCLDQVVAAERSRGLGWRPVRRILGGGLEEAFAEWQAERDDPAAQGRPRSS